MQFFKIFGMVMVGLAGLWAVITVVLALVKTVA